MKAKAAIYNILAGYSNIIYSIISGLVLVPFYLKDFGSEVYGVWLATGNLVAWLGIMGGALSIVFAQKIAVAYGKNDLKEFRAITGSGVLLFTLLAFIIFFGVWAVSDLFLGMFDFDKANYATIQSALKYSAMASAISVYHSLLIFLLGAWFKTAPVLKATILAGGIGILLNIVLLFAGFGLLSIPLSILCKSVIMLILLFRSVYREWIKLGIQLPFINIQHARYFAVCSGPIMVSNIASIGLNHSQSTIIGIIFGPTAATVVSVTDKLYSLVKTFIYPIGNAFLQLLSSIVHLPLEFESISKKFMQQVDWLALFGVLFCFTLNQPFISLWVGEEHYGGDLLSAALAFSALLIIRVNVLISVLNAKALFKITSLYTVTDLAIRIVMIFVLYFVIGMKTIALLPIAECIGILIATRATLSRRINTINKQQRFVYLIFLSILLFDFMGLQLPAYHLYFKIASLILAVTLLVVAAYKLIKGRILNEIIHNFLKRKPKQVLDV